MAFGRGLLIDVPEHIVTHLLPRTCPLGVDVCPDVVLTHLSCRGMFKAEVPGDTVQRCKVVLVKVFPQWLSRRIQDILHGVEACCVRNEVIYEGELTTTSELVGDDAVRDPLPTSATSGKQHPPPNIGHYTAFGPVVWLCAQPLLIPEIMVQEPE